jgi:hypothetical protein
MGIVLSFETLTGRLVRLAPFLVARRWWGRVVTPSRGRFNAEWS